jgi:tetratricopeptide (TPR) repeat protein
VAPERADGDPLAEARAHRENEQIDEALDAYERAATSRPQDATVLLEFGDTLRRVGSLDRATEATQRAVSLAEDPKLRAIALLQLGDLYVDTGQLTAAEAAFTEAREGSQATDEGIIEAAESRLKLLARQVGTRRPPLKISSSVRRAGEGVGPEELPPSALVAAILRLHPEYGDRLGGSVHLDESARARQRTVDDWLSEVRSLFDEEKVPELHGRAVIVGLALVDADLRERLEEGGFLDALIGELREPPETVLTLPGARLWRDREARASADVVQTTETEETPTHTDNPALVDELGRKGFAKVLARRITDMRAEEKRNAQAQKIKKARKGGSFLVHLHAPWGAGKTSTLNFLADELRSEGWVVVNFNAWRHQRIVPPWWWLMTTIYSEALRELRTKWRDRHEGWLRAHAQALSLWAREWLWRLRGGWAGFPMLLLGAVLLVVVWRAGFLSLRGEGVVSFETVRGVLVAAAAVVSPVLTLWGVVRGASRWVFATSARGARRFMDNMQDPMRAVQDHVKDLIHWIGRDVVVLIDDLDRCKGPYVVELLEGIQTIFREIPVAYVAAADRDWLSDSYATEYRKFVSAADEPGRPLGYLFLEKTFQIAATLPPIGGQLHGFWHRLLRSASLPSEQELERARAKVASDLAGKDTDELWEAAEAAKAKAREAPVTETESVAAELQVVLETVAVEAASKRAADEAAHSLEPFKDLLDPNPRAMKRLINAYGIARGSETLRGHNLERDPIAEQRTALWTILNLRWPKLGDHLVKYPEHVEAIGNGKPPSKVAADLRPLFDDPDVVAVLRGAPKGVDARLDADVIREYTKPTASPR